MFKRLPFGINLASEIFQRKMSEPFENDAGIEVIIDDILVHGKTAEEHNRRLERTLRILQDVGVILNMSKCRFRVPRLIYFGHLVGAEGMSPHPDKVAAIRDLPPPTNLSELKSVNGLFDYVSKFVPHLSSIMKPMTDLLKSDTAWVWGPPQEEALAKAKDLLCSAPALSYYNPKLPTTGSADASSFGLGAVLLQQHDGDWKPVAFCSRTLTPTEVNWAQMEKECLAAVWACEKFSRYLVLLPGNWPQVTSSPCHHQESWWCTCEVPQAVNENDALQPWCPLCAGQVSSYSGCSVAQATAWPEYGHNTWWGSWGTCGNCDVWMARIKDQVDEPNAIRGPEKLRRHLIFKSKIRGNTFSNMENPETINHNVWICCLLWNMPENKDTSGLAVSHGPEQVKLPVGQVDLNRFFLFISYKQIEKFQNSWSWASDDFEKRQALHLNTLIRNAKYVARDFISDLQLGLWGVEIEGFVMNITWKRELFWNDTCGTRLRWVNTFF